jgi:hypothetical protein
VSDRTRLGALKHKPNPLCQSYPSDIYSLQLT